MVEYLLLMIIFICIVCESHTYDYVSKVNADDFFAYQRLSFSYVEGYGFAIIWLQEDMNVLTERDRLRECSVGEEVIRKMVTKFEKPESNELAYIVESPVSLASVLETLYRTRSIHQSSLKTTSQIEPTINPLHELNLAMNRFIHQRVSSCPDPTQQHIMATKLGIRKKNILKACKHDPSMMMETMAQLDILMSREDA